MLWACPLRTRSITIFIACDNEKEKGVRKGDLPYRDEYHGEYEVLAEQRHHQTGGRNDLHHQQEEHVETNEDRD
jgi:hypothetical protein